MTMKLGWQPKRWLEKKAKKGVRSYPAGTIAFYGPDDRRATKVAASVILFPHAEPIEIRRWFAETGDVRKDGTILAEVATFLREHDVRSVAMVDAIIGCPHEEGTDYPDGENCPKCPFWIGRDRWAGARKAGE
jgi:hypothetical protein